MAISTGAAILGGAALSGVMGSRAARSAARTQAGAAGEAVGEERRQFDLTREDFAPYRETGTKALYRLADLLGISTPESKPEGYGSLMDEFGLEDFEADPGYAFRLSEGEKLIDRRASAAGNRLSPATQKALLRFSSDLASQEFGNAFSRNQANKLNAFNMLSGVAGTGQAATGATAQAGAQSAGNIGNYLTQAGNAQAAGTVGAANAWTSGIGNALNMWSQQNMLDQYLKSPNVYRTPPYAGAYDWSRYR